MLEFGAAALEHAPGLIELNLPLLDLLLGRPSGLLECGHAVVEGIYLSGQVGLPAAHLDYAEEAVFDVSRDGHRHCKGDERDEHAGYDGDRDCGVSGSQAQDRKALATHAPSDHVPDIGDDAADHHQGDDQEDPREICHRKLLPGQNSPPPAL